MENNSFDFLNHCLDKDTCSYLSLGLDAENPKGEILGKEELLNRISKMLSVDSIMDSPFNETLINALKPYLGIVGLQSSNSEREMDMGKMIDNIFNRFIFYLQSQWFISSTLKFFYIPFLPLYVVYKFLTKGKSISLLDLMSLKTKTIYYPYFILAILTPNYPDGYPNWLLYPVQETMKTYGKKLKDGWRKYVKSLFKATDSQNEFTHLMFLVCVLWVFKSEYEKLNTDVLLSGLPIQLPDLQTSEFLREKISIEINQPLADDSDKKQPYQFYASLLLGVYKSLETKDSLLDSEVEEQCNGNKSKQIEAIKPVGFTRWQAEMLIRSKALNPIFALMSSLRYSRGEEYAKRYYEFQPYEKKEGCKKLLIDHFFPYNHLQSDYTVMTVGQDDILPSSNGESAEEWSYFPPTEKGINLELIDKLYLYFNHLPLDILKHPESLSVNGYDIIQVEKVDADVVRRYATLFSDRGCWSVVKNRFESEVENRVSDFVSDLRHNIFHHLGPCQTSMKEILNFIEMQEKSKYQQRNLTYTREGIRNLKNIVRLLSVQKNSILEEQTTETLNFLRTLSEIVDSLRESGELSRISISLNNENIPEDFKFIFWGEAAGWFRVMLQNIINNACVHGFPPSDLPAFPKIVIQTKISNQTLSLKIMNNGRRSEISIEEYKASGLSGSKGHEGLGGAQIDEIARRHGGKIYLGSSEEWNFILNIDFRL